MAQISLKHPIELFLKTVLNFPKNVALEDGFSQMNYEELSVSVSSLAAILKFKSGQNPFIVSYLSTSANHVINTLATLAMGKIIALPHENYSQIQMEKVLSKLHNPLVVTTTSLWKQFNQLNYPFLHFMDIESSPDMTNLPTAPDSANELKGISYVFFTSGSTGEPKAALIPDTSIIGHSLPIIRDYSDAFNSSMRTVLNCAVTFSPTIVDIWTVIFTGGTLVIPPKAIKVDMDAYRPWLTSNRITNMIMSTPILEILLDKDVETLTTLKHVFFGGAILNPNRMNLKQATFKTYQAYGMTELMIVSIAYIPPGTEKPNVSGGIPYDTIKIYIVNEDGQEVIQPAERGEICVRSDIVMRGYYGQPQITNQVLIPNPFDPNGDSLIFRTGDIGYWSPNWELHVVGRKDQQLKIHGIRLDLGEVEMAILTFPGIRQAVVLGKKIGETMQLLAFCTLKQDIPIPPTESIQQYLLAHIQRHAIPASFTFLDNFPLTSTGKIDRQALAKLDVTPIDNGNTSIPEPELMHFVRTAWEAVLGFSVKVNDNFFYIGGNSIHGVKATHLIRQKFPDLSFQEIFRFPVLKDFVESIDPNTTSTKTQTIDWDSEIVLPRTELDFRQQRLNPDDPPSGILLTGATGFLGSLLLPELLNAYPNSEIYCIVRAKTDAEAKERLKQSIESKSFRNGIKFDRIKCIPGNIGIKNFGISQFQYTSLVCEIGTIFHAAADVSFMKTYEQLRTSTVAMTSNIIAFAANSSPPKAIQFMSSVSVFDGVEVAIGPKRCFIATESPLPSEVNPSRMSMGYSQSKWVSEQLIAKAAEKFGVPVSIYRIGQIGCHPPLGCINRQDAITGFIATCCKIKKYPITRHVRIPYLDADSCVDAIICLSLNEKFGTGKKCNYFHVTGQIITLADFFSHAENIMPVPITVWERSFMESMDIVGSPESKDEVSAWVFFKMINGIENSTISVGNITYETKNTISGLGKYKLTSTPSEFTSCLLQQL